MNTARLHEALAAVCSVEGVSIGRADDPATWRIDFAPEATKAQRAAAKALLKSFDPAAVDPADVKAEAARRIEAVMPRWMIDRRVSGGDPIPEEVKAAAAAIRARSGEIEAMDPIPADFREDGYWPA